MNRFEGLLPAAENPYAVGVADNMAESPTIPPTVIAICTGVFAGIFGAMLAATGSWFAIRILLFTLFPHSSYFESFTSAIALPGFVGISTGIMIGMRVGRKVGAVFGRLRNVTQKRSDLAADALLTSQMMRRDKQ